MIKIFENVDFVELEKDVNKWIQFFGTKINDIQFRTALNNDGIIFHSMIVADLDWTN